MTCYNRKDVLMGVEADAHTDALHDFESTDGKKQMEENRNNQKEKKDNKNRKLENMSKQTSLNVVI